MGRRKLRRLNGPNLPRRDKEVFDKQWKSNARAVAELHLKHSGLNEHHPRYWEYLAQDTMGILKNGAPRKAIQERIFGALYFDNGLRDEVLDLMSGEAVATLSLLECNKYKKLALLDDDTSSGFSYITAQKSIELDLDDKIEFIRYSIGKAAEPLIPNEMMDVLLADTGVALPKEFRFPELDPDETKKVLLSNPLASRAGHIIHGHADFGDVIESLGEISGRTLRVFDTPYFATPMTANQGRDYIQGFLDGTGWKITKWTNLNRSPIIHGVLQHE